MSRKVLELVRDERIGVLCGRDAEVLAEARRRGLIGTPSDPVAEAVKQSGHLVQMLADALKNLRPPVINIPETNVTVEATMPPSRVTVNQVQQPMKWTFRVNRDRNGWIESITAEAGE